MYFVIDRESSRHWFIDANSVTLGPPMINIFMKDEKIVKDLTGVFIKLFDTECEPYPYALEAYENGWRGNGPIPVYHDRKPIRE